MEKKNIDVLTIQEKERQRIARDLHDTSLQNLAHLVHKIELCSMYIDQDPLRAKLELATANQSLKRIIEEIRNTIFELRPMSFDDLGLKETFERLFIKLKETYPHVDFIMDIDSLPGGNDLVLMSIFRLVKECCKNALQHSECNKVLISMKIFADNCVIIIEDNGKGFDQEQIFLKNKNHFGLSIMKERVEILKGELEIISKINNGTIIKIQIPMESIRGN